MVDLLSFKATSVLVTEVPTLAPMIIGIATGSVNTRMNRFKFQCRVFGMPNRVVHDSLTATAD